ncbi:hypothetical protein L4C44_01380 [Vibrio satsumensis]|uniref:hypothetical protein n=1 Tax=Vibrio TaxID=662 RepID=UPI001B316569|nr:hypothetical protein [Vibrio crassostreae]
MNHYVNKTLELMEFFGFETRDTFLVDQNLDDFYVNDNSYNGPRHFDVVWVCDGYPGVNAERRYSLEGFESVAYNEYKIEMPERYRTLGREDIIYHETAHFLQKNTVENEENYIRFDGTNYVDYISQRCEYEAHLVQIKYIIDEMSEYLATKASDTELASFTSSVLALSTGTPVDKSMGISVILRAKELAII